jgi:hypothetical protein
MAADFSFVYLIRERDSDYTKIGVTDDPTARLTALQTANPRELWVYNCVLFATRALALAAEHKAHEVFSKCWVRGEWFDLPLHQARKVHNWLKSRGIHWKQIEVT